MCCVRTDSLKVVRSFAFGEDEKKKYFSVSDVLNSFFF